MKHRANHRRLRRLLNTLLDIYDRKEYPFNQPKVQPPQLFLPQDFPTGGLTHAFFLFVLCYWMRGGIESDTAILSLYNIFKLDSDLFDPRKVMHENPKHLADLLKFSGLGFAKDDNSEFWVENAALLVARWDGDPRNIFNDFNRYGEKKKWDVAVSRIKNHGKRGSKAGFSGFREKMVSMLIYFLMEQGLIEKFDFPIPVDFHVARMLVIHKVFELEPNKKYTGKQLDLLLDDMRYTSYRFAKRHGVTSLVLSNILWLYSRSMCSENPVFMATFGGGTGRSIVIIPPRVIWTPAKLRSFARTCGSCQVSETCEYVVRSAHWYKHSSIVTDCDRQEPGQLILLSPAENARSHKGGVANVQTGKTNTLRATVPTSTPQNQLGLPFE